MTKCKRTYSLGESYLFVYRKKKAAILLYHNNSYIYTDHPNTVRRIFPPHPNLVYLIFTVYIRYSTY